jgi:hypothetical protein
MSTDRYFPNMSSQWKVLVSAPGNPTNRLLLEVQTPCYISTKRHFVGFTGVSVCHQIPTRISEALPREKNEYFSLDIHFFTALCKAKLPEKMGINSI